MGTWKIRYKLSNWRFYSFIINFVFVTRVDKMLFLSQSTTTIEYWVSINLRQFVSFRLWVKQYSNGIKRKEIVAYILCITVEEKNHKKKKTAVDE